MSIVSCRYGRFSIPDRDDLILNALYKYGEWAQQEIDVLTRFIYPGDTIIDAGAFVGTHARAFSRIVGEEGKVIAFEPNPTSYECLSENANLAQYANITTYQIALGDRLPCSGLSLVQTERNLGGTKISESRTDANGIVVRVQRLDDFDFDRIRFIKADLEGMEFPMLLGAEKTVSRDHPVIFLEVNNLQSSIPVLGWAHVRGYMIFGLISAAFNPDNFNGVDENTFGEAVECGLLLIHRTELAARESVLSDMNMPAVDSADSLALLLLHKPQYFHEAFEETLIAKALGLDVPIPPVRELAVQVAERDRQIGSLNQTVATHDERITVLSQDVAERDGQIVALDASVKEKEGRIGLLEEIVREKDNQIISLSQMAAERDAQIISLNQTVAERDGQIVAILSSTSWRLTRPLRWVADHLKRMRRWFRFSLRTILFAPKRFDAECYLKQNPDVAMSGIDPYKHYILFGKTEGRKPTFEEPLLHGESVSVVEQDVQISPIDKMRWSIDSLVVREKVVFGFGWLFHESIEIQNLKFVVYSSSGEILCRIFSEYGKYRLDVSQTFINSSNAQNSGFLIYGSCSSDVDTWDKVLLEGLFATGEDFSLQVPISNISNLDHLPVKSDRILTKRFLKRFLHLLLKRQFSTLTYKVLHKIRSHPKSQIKSAMTIIAKLSTNERKNVILIVDHDLGGGANLYRERLVTEKILEGKTVLILSFHVSNLTHVLIIRNERLQERYLVAGVNFILSLAQNLPFLEMVYNNAVSFARPNEIPWLLVELKTQLNCRLILLVHDFFMVCPSYHLLNDQGVFCGIPDISKCEQCLPCNQQSAVTLFTFNDIKLWRSLWGDVIRVADEIIVFSKNSLKLLCRAYPEIIESSVNIKPHCLEYMQCVSVEPNYKNTLIIGIVGNIGYAKGAHIVRELSFEVKRRDQEIKIVIIGTIDAKCDTSIVQQTGSYKREYLPELIRKSGANIMLFPSICPETFSYVAHEIVKLELPLACFNIGAQAEIVSTYTKGLVLEKQDASSVLDALIEFHKENYLKKRGVMT